MSQKLSVNDCKWVEAISEFNEDFLKSYSDESNEGHIFEVVFSILKIYITLTII